MFLKVAPDILPKLLPKAAVQSYCPKAAILQTYALKRLPKAILQSGSRKLLPKVATESCSPKWFVYRQIVILRPDALCCPEIYRDVPGMLVMMMMMIEDLHWMQEVNGVGRIKPLLKIFNECKSLTGWEN